MTAAFVTTKTGRDALYFQRDGLHDLPMAYFGMAALSLPMASVMLSLMRVLGPARTRLAAPLIFASVLILFSGLATPGGGPLMTFFFMLVPVVFGGLFSVAWLQTADVLRNPRPGNLARAYSRGAAASILGGLLGAVSARLLAPHIDPRHFLTLGGTLLVVAAAVMTWSDRPIGQRSVRRLQRPPRLAVEWRDAMSLLESRYFRLLLSLGTIAALVGVLVEFQFYVAAAASREGGREKAAFFADFYLVMNAAAFFVQVFVTPRLQGRWGLAGVLGVLPASLLAFTPALLLSASVVPRASVRVAEGGLKASIHRGSWEQLYLGIDGSMRARAKLFIDGVATRGAEGVGALGLYLWLRMGTPNDVRDPASIAVALLLASGAWLVVARRMGRALGDVPGSGTWASAFAPLPDS